MLINHNHRRARGARIGRIAACLASIVLCMACGESSQNSAVSPPLDPAPALTIGAQEQRPARVVLPRDYNIEHRYPLVILLHGYGGTGNEQDVIFHLAQHTTRDQFILVLPDGTLNSHNLRFWDATPECCNFEVRRSTTSATSPHS